MANDMAGRLVYAMRISEKMSFADFWNDSRFERKRPNLRSSTCAAYGDNIYEPTADGEFIQHDSHHSLADGTVNLFNRNKDTGTDHVLISDEYVYYGRSARPVPAVLRDYLGYDLCATTQGHLSRFPVEFVDRVDEWFEELPDRNLMGLPADWD